MTTINSSRVSGQTDDNILFSVNPGTAHDTLGLNPDLVSIDIHNGVSSNSSERDSLDRTGINLINF